jgi:membrane dipeptidase
VKLCLATLVILAPLIIASMMGAPASERARKVHNDAFVFDAHIHAIDRRLYHGGDFGQRASNGQFDLVRAKEGGLDAMFLSVFVIEDYYPQRFETKQVLRLIDVALTQMERNRDKIELARNAADIKRINAAGKIAAVLDLEGGFDLDGDLGVLRNLYRLGLRSAQLPAHNWANNFADSCCSTAKYKGLNERGHAVVREMNRLGMVINVSHASDETIAQTVELSTGPVVATHHGLRAVNNIPRNMPDELLRKIAAKGGVIGFQIGNEFHNVKAFNWRTQHAGKPFWDTKEIAGRKGQLTMEEIDSKVAPQFPMVGLNMPDDVLFSPDDWIAVVEKAIGIAGEDHVALGSDFDGGPTLPRGMRDISDLAMLTDAMIRRGWSEERIRKFLGLNLLRVFRQITEGK